MLKRCSLSLSLFHVYVTHRPSLDALICTLGDDLTFVQVIYGLIYLFYEPNPDDPLNHEAADLYRNNISRFQQVRVLMALHLKKK